MAFPIKVCAVCGEEFELKPGKPGFANRCPSCSEEDADRIEGRRRLKSDKGANAARRDAMRNRFIARIAESGLLSHVYTWDGFGRWRTGVPRPLHTGLSTQVSPHKPRCGVLAAGPRRKIEGQDKIEED